MHQISLLGGLGTAQHADSAHFLRPDRVYRTSVLAPMTGFRPGEAVMATAQDFTQGPYSGMSLGAARYEYAPGRIRAPLRGPLFPRLRLWWEGVKARARGAVPILPVQATAAATTVPTASEKQVHAPGGSLPPTAQGQGNAWGNPHGYQTAPMYQTGVMVGPLTAHLPQDMVTRAYGQSPMLPPFASDAASKTTMMMWRGLRWPWH